MLYAPVVKARKNVSSLSLPCSNREQYDRNQSLKSALLRVIPEERLQLKLALQIYGGQSREMRLLLLLLPQSMLPQSTQHPFSAPTAQHPITPTLPYSWRSSSRNCCCCCRCCCCCYKAYNTPTAAETTPSPHPAVLLAQLQHELRLLLLLLLMPQSNSTKFNTPTANNHSLLTLPYSWHSSRRNCGCFCFCCCCCCCHKAYNTPTANINVIASPRRTPGTAPAGTAAAAASAAAATTHTPPNSTPQLQKTPSPHPAVLLAQLQQELRLLPQSI
jgi:hypothetical protein